MDVGVASGCKGPLTSMRRIWAEKPRHGAAVSPPGLPAPGVWHLLAFSMGLEQRMPLLPDTLFIISTFMLTAHQKAQG
jgi:hypothetical protein